MAETKLNLVIVFHSYPSKPCIDGILSAIIMSKMYPNANISYIPYWRTEECFQNIKSHLNEIGIEGTEVMYVDCSPDLHTEVDFLLSIIHAIKVTVYDHHPKPVKTPMDALTGNANFSFIFDSDKCVSLMVYELLDETPKKLLDIDNLLQLVQFSEYEAMDEKFSGKLSALKIADESLNKATRLNNNEKIRKLINSKMSLYYLLDSILPNKNGWEFLYNSDYKQEKFHSETEKYLASTRSITQGRASDVFSEITIDHYLKKLTDMTAILNEARIIRGRVADLDCNILICHIDIFQFGRTLEPFVREKIQGENSSYMILVNDPYKDNNNQVMYYLSLRRVDDRYNARDLADFIMKQSGSTIGGGHPWSSGATLTEMQYKQFITKTK